MQGWKHCSLRNSKILLGWTQTTPFVFINAAISHYTEASAGSLWLFCTSSATQMTGTAKGEKVPLRLCWAGISHDPSEMCLPRHVQTDLGLLCLCPEPTGTQSSLRQKPQSHISTALCPNSYAQSDCPGQMPTRLLLLSSTTVTWEWMGYKSSRSQKIPNKHN